MSCTTDAEGEATEVAGHVPTVVHVRTADRPVPVEVVAAATADPRRFAEVPAGDWST